MKGFILLNIHVIKGENTMTNNYPKKLNERIYLIDGFDMGESERTGTYVIDEQNLLLVETGPSPSVKYVKSGLEVIRIFIRPSEIHNRYTYSSGSCRRSGTFIGGMSKCSTSGSSKRSKTSGRTRQANSWS